MSLSERGKVLSVNSLSISGKRLPTFELMFFTGEEITIFSIDCLKGREVLPSELKGFLEDITVEGVSHVNPGSYLKLGELVVKVKSVGKEDISEESVRGRFIAKFGLRCEVKKDAVVRIGDEVTIMRPISVGLIIASDKGARGEREDISGKVIEEKLVDIGGEVKHYFVVPDELDVISGKIRELVNLGCDLIFTSGGTGWSKRDVTPEATLKVIEREIPGLAEIMRIEGYKRTPFSVLSRAVAGIVGETVVINLPGSPKGVRESLDLIMPVLLHGIGVLKGWDKECGKVE